MGQWFYLGLHILGVLELHTCREMYHNWTNTLLISISSHWKQTMSYFQQYARSYPSSSSWPSLSLFYVNYEIGKCPTHDWIIIGVSLISAYKSSAVCYGVCNQRFIAQHHEHDICSCCVNNRTCLSNLPLVSHICTTELGRHWFS